MNKLILILALIFLVLSLFASTREEPGDLIWCFEVDGNIVNSSPALDGSGNIYFGSTNNLLYSISGEGVENWSFDTGGIISASPSITSDGNILIGSCSNSFFALNADGSVQWQYNDNASFKVSASVDCTGRIYVANETGKLYAFSPTGDVLWSHQFSVDPEYPALITPDGSIIISSGTRTYALSKEGDMLWQFNASNPINTPLTSNGDNIFFATQSHFYGVDIYSGEEVIQEYQENYIKTSPVMDTQGNFYVAVQQERINVLNPQGTLSWNIELGSQSYTTLAIDEASKLYLGCDDNTVRCYSNIGNQEWSFTADGNLLTSPVLSQQGVIYICSQTGQLYAIQAGGVGPIQSL